MVVLVVEDQTLVRMFMADFLDEAGFKVFEAVNADEALTVLQARSDVQAVGTDIEMPAGSMNGLMMLPPAVKPYACGAPRSGRGA
jgi:two-component system, response regulator PdtaR